MSTHGRRRRGPEPPGPDRLGPEPPGPEPPGPGQFGWALLVIAAALIGGLAAATLVNASITIAVIVSLVAGGIAVLIAFRSPARPRELAPGEPQDADFGRYAAPGRRPAPPLPPDPRAATHDPRTVPSASFAPSAPEHTAPGLGVPDGQARNDPPAANEAVAQLMPLPLQPGTAGPPDAPWWDSAQGAPAPSAGAKRAPAPDLSTYLASTFIAQCPRCGAFRLDIGRARTGWDFRCESCEYTWTWQPGTPWPPVRVMPKGRRE